MIITKTNMTQ